MKYGRELAGCSKVALVLLAQAGWLMPVAVHAQDVPATPAQEEAAPASDVEAVNEDDIITVTASRVNRTGYTAPTPTTMIGVEDLQNRAATNIADVLNSVPSFGQGTTPSSTNHTSVSSGANLVNLRNLGATRTLVLVDGRRFVPSTVQGRVDLNVIPTVLIERTEVVTGGASAAWGSDAVAGVVNLIFKKKMTGIQGEVQYGISDYSDNKKLRAALSAGFDFADGRGNFVIAGEYEDAKGVGANSKRSELTTDNWGVISNPNYVLGNGQSQSLLVNNVNVSTATLGGIITSGSLKGTYFLPGGEPSTFTYGDYVGSQYMIGGTSIGSSNQTQLGTIEVPVERYNIYGRTSFEVSDSVNLFAEASYARSRSDFDLSIAYDLGTLTIYSDNAYLPSSTAAALATAEETSFKMGRINLDLGYNNPVATNETQRYMVGGEGGITGDWRWNAYFQFGQNHYYQEVRNNRISANWLKALDAVVDSSTGQIICRSTLTDPTNGCVPINLFGENSASQAAVDYVTGASWQDAVYKEKSAAIDFAGTAFENWAGPVSIALGAEWREDSVSQTVDEISAVSGYNIHNPKPLNGSVNVKEVFTEVVFPLLKDVPFVQSLDLNGAVRFTDYSSSGGVTSWKLGATWEVNDSLRLRATRSRDIRAAALGELFSSSITQSATIIDPILGIQYATLAPQQGNATLAPEIGDTWTVGAVIKPAFIPGFTASIDYYNIKVTDAIALPSTTTILNGCYTYGFSTYCDLITRGSSGYSGTSERISQILRQYVNLGEMKSAGIDFDLSYHLPLDRLFGDMDGSLSFRFLATYLDKYLQVNSGVSDNLLGVVGTGQGGMPRWRWNASVNYAKGPLGVFVEGRYTGGGVYNDDVDSAGQPLISTIDGKAPKIDSQFLLNTTVSYTIKKGGSGNDVQIFGSVKNIFDNIATGNPLSYILPATSNPALYDIIGRQYAIGARFKF